MGKGGEVELITHLQKEKGWRVHVTPLNLLMHLNYNLQGYFINCQPGLIFVESIDSCDWEYNVECCGGQI